jgi:hypothetical protein
MTLLPLKDFSSWGASKEFLNTTKRGSGIRYFAYVS